MDNFTFYAAKPIEKYHKIDISLFISMILLWGLGIFTLLIVSQSAGERLFKDSFYFTRRQLACSLVGFVLFIAFMLLDMKVIKKMVPLIVIGSVILCILVFTPLGIEKNGARRWIKMPLRFSFQPSELVKFAVILFLANFFEKQSKVELEEDKTVLPGVIGLMFFVGLVFLQKDFSTGVFIALIGILIFFISGEKLKWMVPFAFIAIPTIILMICLEQYRMERLIGFFRPNEFASDVNYQMRNSKIAISAGGFFGNGIGKGLFRINSIPEVQADYIFAGWAEAMGFVGVILYLFLLGFFAWRGYRTAFKCPSRFSAYASFGCVSVIFLQSLVNCMVVCGLLPSTGIPLPFFSLGGSSIIMTMIMCGFILNASRGEELDEKVNKNDDSNIESLLYI